MTETFIPLDNKNCLTCAYLVTDAKVFRDQCPSLGTSLCPAGQFKIGIGVNIDKASTSIALALYEKDAEKLAKLLNKLTKFPKSETTKVLDLVFDKTAAHYGIVVGDAGEEEEAEQLATSAIAAAGAGDDEDGDLKPAAITTQASNAAASVDSEDEDADLVAPTSIAASTASTAPVGQVQRAPVATQVVVEPVATVEQAQTSTVVEAEQSAAPAATGSDEPAEDEWADGGAP